MTYLQAIKFNSKQWAAYNRFTMWLVTCLMANYLNKSWQSSHLGNGRPGTIRRPLYIRKTWEGFSGPQRFPHGKWWMAPKSVRFPRHLLLELCNNLEPQLRRETQWSNAIPVPVQVLSTLGFLATGALSARALGQVRYFTAHHQQDDASSLSGYQVSFQTIHCFSL